jgi:hypothetical protein
MKLTNIKASDMFFDFIGALHGIAKYYNYAYTQQWMMGGTGFAFFINIHKELCPSAPFVFNYDGFLHLTENLGLKLNPLGFVHGDMPKNIREDLETKVKTELDKGNPSIIQNMNNQIITGYNETSFLLDPHYPNMEQFYPKKLTFGTWKEMSEELHCMIWGVEKIETQNSRKVIMDTLKFGQQLIKGNYPNGPNIPELYKTGLPAYDQWLSYLDSNDGNNHGFWYNSCCWMECRNHASKFFRDLIDIDESHDQELSKLLEQKYEQIAHFLGELRITLSPVNTKRRLLAKAKKIESSSIEDLIKLEESFK